MSRICLPVLLMIFVSACNGFSRRDRIVVLQPLGGFAGSDLRKIQSELRPVFGTVLLRPVIALPAEAFYPGRNRYRADSLLRILAAQGNSDTVIVGLLNEDISTTKGARADWGVMGLGYRPGNACVVSTYRLRRSNRAAQFYKVVVHELGHTQGLPHCPEKTCFMRDAEGGNPLDEECGFCTDCTGFLTSKGWKLQH